MTMAFDDSPADNNDRPFDYADANDSEEDGDREPVGVHRNSGPWFTPSGDGDATGGGPYTSGSAIEEFGSED
jgi:hypothetical protein